MSKPPDATDAAKDIKDAQCSEVKIISKEEFEKLVKAQKEQAK